MSNKNKRQVNKNQTEELILGLVRRNTGSHYLVLCDDGIERTCWAKGNLRLKGFRSTNPIVVGDRVEVIIKSEQEDDAHFIKTILPRRNYIIRRSTNLSKESHILASNVDASFLICTITSPDTSTTFIDRFLANAEAYAVPTELIFNKCDLLKEEVLGSDEGMKTLNSLVELYTSIGYRCYCVSAETGEGLDAVRERMKGKITLFSGHSGVGKSTLINALIPNADLRTGLISQVHQSGMHTTTFSEMIPLPEGDGYLIDTPGIKGFGLLDVEIEEASHYFPEIFEYGASCRFGNCTHTHEPNCAVRQAIDDGLIAPSRFISYLSILEDKDEGKYRPANIL